jgi:SAM-dependent methyltransferase
LAGGARRVLDVAAASAVHAGEMSRRGVSTVALDPSPTMLRAARESMSEVGAPVMLVRAIAEALPFQSRSFDRILCHGAIDHVAAPAAAMREMARVLADDGRLVLSAVNYRGASVLLSRALYAAARRLRFTARDVHLFWDSPVPVEHTFECTYRLLSRLGAPHLELERCFGVSIGWGVPGWGAFLRRLPRRLAVALLLLLDGCAYRLPAVADFVYTVWRAPTGRSQPR